MAEARALLPLWEAILHPAAWAALRARPEHPPLLSGLFSALLNAAARRARHADGHASVVGSAGASGGILMDSDDLSRWRADELSQTLTLCAAELGQTASCAQVGVWVQAASSQPGAGQGGEWAALEAALFCAAALVLRPYALALEDTRALEGGAAARAELRSAAEARLRADAAPLELCWHMMLASVMDGMALPRGEEEPRWADPPLFAAFDLAVAVAERVSASVQAGNRDGSWLPMDGSRHARDGAVAAARCCLSYTGCASRPQLARRAAESLVRICRCAGQALLSPEADGVEAQVAAAAAHPSHAIADHVQLLLLAAHLALQCEPSRYAAELQRNEQIVVQLTTTTGSSTPTPSDPHSELRVLAVASCAPYLQPLHASLEAAAQGADTASLEVAVAHASTLGTLLLTRCHTSPPPTDALAAYVLTCALLSRWLPALRHAVARHNSEDVASEAAELLAVVTQAASTVVAAAGPRRLQGLPLSIAGVLTAAQFSELIASAIGYSAEVFCAHGHAACLESLANLLKSDHASAAPSPPASAVAAPSGLVLTASAASVPAATLAATVNLPAVQAALLHALGAAVCLLGTPTRETSQNLNLPIR